MTFAPSTATVSSHLWTQRLLICVCFTESWKTLVFHISSSENCRTIVDMVYGQGSSCRSTSAIKITRLQTAVHMLVRRYHTEEAQQNDAAEVGVPSVVCKLWETAMMIIEQRNREVSRSPRNRTFTSLEKQRETASEKDRSQYIYLKARQKQDKPYGFIALACRRYELLLAFAKSKVDFCTDLCPSNSRICSDIN